MNVNSSGAKAQFKGRLLYITRNGELYSIKFDGTDQKLVAGNDRSIQFAYACGDGKHIAFSKTQGDESEIWRIDADGSNPIQLTHDKAAIFPVCSADGQWVTYARGETLQVWRIGIDGGTPTRLPVGNNSAPIVIPSRDNKMILYRLRHPDAPQTRDQLVTVPIDGGAPIYSIEIPTGVPVGRGFPQWSPDGHGIDLPRTRSGVTNLWRQPLPNGPIKQLTNFTSGEFFSVRWSPDGKTLFLARGSRSSDIILLKSRKN